MRRVQLAAKYVSSIYQPWSLVVLHYTTKILQACLIKVKITAFVILRTERKKEIHIIFKKLLL